ncbi:MAG: DMT family transporter [Qingshengfaniella sp.]
MTLAIIAALTASALFGLSIHVQAKALAQVPGVIGAATSVIATTILLWAMAPFTIDWAWWLAPGMWMFALCGTIFPALGQFFQITSVKHVGPSLTAAIGSFTPVIAIALSVIVLHEPLTLQSAIGVILMVTALLASNFPTPRSGKRWPLWVLCIPLGAATARGIVQPLIKIGLEDIPSPFFATLVMFTVSAAVLGAIAFLPRRQAIGARLNPGHGWFALSGLINCAGILALAYGLQNGAVTVVAPLASTTPLWAVLFGKLFFTHETVGLKHLFIAALMVFGAVIVVTGRV